MAPLAEADWLLQVKFSPGDLVQPQYVLWHHPASSPILRHGKKGIDPTSFSDLVAERYIDSFVIEICMNKILDESSHGRNVTVYFPTEFHVWMSSDDKQFQQLQLSQMKKQLAHFSDLQQILVPVYMPKNWGLIFIDLVNQDLYFDDGLVAAVPRMALPYVKKSLDLLLEMYLYHPALQCFRMPSQA